MSNKNWLVIVGLVLMVSSILAACGGDDGDPISLDKLSYEGVCSSYDLRVKYEGKDDHTHTIQQLEPGTDAVINSSQWASGGIFFWRGLKCNAEQPSWVESENLCRYEVRVVSNDDSTLMSKRQSIDVKCD